MKLSREDKFLNKWAPIFGGTIMAITFIFCLKFYPPGSIICIAYFFAMLIANALHWAYKNRYK
mgnify:CR=1 FL=1